MDNPIKRKLKLFEAHGIELEYMIVDQETLGILPLTDQLFYQLVGKWTMEVDRGPISLNNELALHVLEMKTTEPVASLEGLPSLFLHEVLQITNELGHFGAMLMPTAMHPWMDSMTAFQIWPHDDAAIYNKYHQIFDCRGHGWANLQSTHLNLPFADETQFRALHAAIRLLIPLIPALAASSPFADGQSTGMKDFRLHCYRKNAAKIFSIAGHVIPEPINTFMDYHHTILEPIYRDLKPYDPEGILCHEWANSRGAITRFDRNAIEIRLTDIQETPLLDCSIAWALTEVLKLLCTEPWGTFNDYNSICSERLLAVLDKTQVHAETALIEERQLLKLLGWQHSHSPIAGDLWEHLLCNLKQIPHEFTIPLETLLSKGTLASRILKRVGSAPKMEELATTYNELCCCLREGRIFYP